MLQVNYLSEIKLAQYIRFFKFSMTVNGIKNARRSVPSGGFVFGRMGAEDYSPSSSSAALRLNRILPDWSMSMTFTVTS